MPISSGLITDSERAIAGRVRQVRLASQLTQAEFARKIGISLNRFASLEYARTPVTVAVADAIGKHFDVDVHWLATGVGRMHPCKGLILISDNNIKAETLLSRVDFAPLLDKLEIAAAYSLFQMAAIFRGYPPLPKGVVGDRLVACFENDLSEVIAELPRDGKAKLISLLIRAIASFSTEWELGKRKIPGVRFLQSSLEKELTETSDSARGNADVKIAPQWPELKQRLQKATEPVGLKPALAKALGVDPTRISQWLSESENAREPGGDYALRMLKWVEQQERQPK